MALHIGPYVTYKFLHGHNNVGGAIWREKKVAQCWYNNRDIIFRIVLQPERRRIHNEYMINV